MIHTCLGGCGGLGESTCGPHQRGQLGGHQVKGTTL